MAILYKRLIDRDSYKPYSSPKRAYNHESPVISEWQFALIGLIFSLIIIVFKLYHHNYESIRSFVIEPKLVSYEVITEGGVLMYKVTWKNAIKYSNIWLPVVAGFLATYFTWVMIYLDSDVPGIQPPTPLSPSKYRIKSGHTFHLNYVFAIIIGIAVGWYLYFKNVSLQY